MAKKPTKKTKTKAKRVKVILPVPIDAPLLEDVVLEPVPPETVPAAKPLTEATALVGCVVSVKHEFWSGAEYVVLAAAPGQRLPEGLLTGQHVDVIFYPPGQSASRS